MELAEMFYYAEAEGKLHTRAGKINAVIRDVKAYPGSTIGMYEFEKILKKYGLSYGELTPREIQKINSGIR